MTWFSARRIDGFIVFLIGLIFLFGGAARAQDGGTGPAPELDGGGAAGIEGTDGGASIDEESLETQLAIAREQQRLAEEKAQAVSGEKAISDNAKLIKSGVTLGIGAGVQFPIGSTKGTSLQNVSFVTTPYVILLPACWSNNNEVTKEYCASNWSGGSERDASVSALEIARRRASVKFDAIVSAINSGATNE